MAVGLVAALSTFVLPMAVVIIFGFLIEYETWWVDALVYLPPPAIALFGALRRSSPEWRRGFNVGLVLAGFAALIFGLNGFILIAAVATAYLAGRLIAGRFPRAGR